MTRSKNSLIATALIATSLLGYSVSARAAAAIVSAVFGGLPQAVLLAATGAFVLADTAHSPDEHTRTVGLLLGLVVLDGNEGQTYVYRPLSSDEAKVLNVSEKERVAYNDQLDEINDIRESVIADMVEMKNPTVDDAKADWQHYDSALSADAVSALSKISSQAIAQ